MYLQVLLCIFLNSAFSQVKTLTLGGKDGWPHLQKMDGVVIGKGKFGYDAVVLATNSRQADEFTDILLDFENGSSQDITGQYAITKDSMIISGDDPVMGKASGLSRGNGGVRFRGSRNTIFGRTGSCGSFTIEFWLNPSIAENGEIVFSWRSYQMITAAFSGNRLQWSFENVFNGYVDNDGEISLSSYRTIVPDKWMHQAISFDQETGLLEYRINGLLESLKYVTTNSHETGGSIYIPYVGVPADIDICPQYTGLIDDFRIQRTSKSDEARSVRMETYRTSGGRFETEPIMISAGSRLKSIDALVSVPSQTDVEFYVRSGDNYFGWTDTEPAWIPVRNRREIENVKGLYFQVAADLLTDGNAKKTPAVTELKINYEEVPSPLPPFDLRAIAGDGEVTLSWPYSVDDSVGGYYIFYGEHPGEYLGRTAAEGASPIDAGSVTSVTLTGLTNGKIYYFAVSSYSRFDGRIMGDLSREVFARPNRR